MREEGEEALEFGLEEGEEEDPSNRTKPPSPRPLRGGQDEKKRRESRPNYSLDLAEAADFFLRRKIRSPGGN